MSTPRLTHFLETYGTTRDPDTAGIHPHWEQIIKRGHVAISSVELVVVGPTQRIYIEIGHELPLADYKALDLYLEDWCVTDYCFCRPIIVRAR